MNFKQSYLTRFMGSGKSTVGRMVAHMFRWPYSDLDEIIAKKARGRELFAGLKRK